MKNYFFFLFLFLCSCTASANTQGIIRVYDNTIYQNVKPLLMADFTKHGILTEDLPSYNPIDLFNKEWGFFTGRELYNKLTLSFRYPSIEDSKKWTFASLKEDYTKTTMYNHGFIMERGLEKITVSLLGDLDWDKNDVLDWLVYCRFEQKPVTDEISKNDARPAREYFVIVTDRKTAFWQAAPVVIRDLMLFSKGQESTVYRNLTEQKQKALEPGLALDFEAGQTQIIDAPIDVSDEGDKKNQKSKNQKKGAEGTTLREQSLSE